MGHRGESFLCCRNHRLTVSLFCPRARPWLNLELEMRLHIKSSVFKVLSSSLLDTKFITFTILLIIYRKFYKIQNLSSKKFIQNKTNWIEAHSTYLPRCFLCFPRLFAFLHLICVLYGNVSPASAHLEQINKETPCSNILPLASFLEKGTWVKTFH